MFTAFLAASLLALNSEGAVRTSQTQPTYLNPSADVQARVNDLLGRMTLEEEFQQLRSTQDYAVAMKDSAVKGLGFFCTDTMRGTPIRTIAERLNALQSAAMHSRLSIPIITYEEALHGLIIDGHTSFPQAIGLAATWDPGLMSKVSGAIAEETRQQGIRQVLSPVINVDQDSRWGRMEESYGEDPYLTSEMAVAYIKSFRARNVVNTPKHFIDNYGDGGRDSNSIQTSPRQLLNIFAPPFEASFKQAGAQSVMVSYNSLNGVPCAADPYTLRTLLRKTLGFKGYVVSDWGASNNVTDAFHYAKDYEEAAALEIKAGMNSEHPGTMVFGDPLEKAYKDKLFSKHDLDEMVTDVLRVKFENGLFEHPYVNVDESDSSARSQAHEELAYQAALDATVLLQNAHNALPLSPDISRISVIGDLVKAPVPLGDYSSNPMPRQSIWDALHNAAPNTTFNFISGCSPTDTQPMLEFNGGMLTHGNSGEPGLVGEYIKGRDLYGTPAFTRVDKDIDFDWTNQGPSPEIGNTDFCVRWTGFVTFPKSGTYQLATRSDDGSRIYINGALAAQNWFDHPAQTATTQTFHADAGVPIPIKLEYYQAGGEAVMKFGFTQQSEGQPVESVVGDGVAGSQAVLIFATINEGEGYDRAYLDLPGDQESYIRAAALADPNRPVIVVLLAGSAVTMQHWINLPNVSVIDAWYPGEQGGRAIADILWGKAEPGGRLPMCFPRTVGQEPLYYNAEMTGRGFDYGDLTYQPQFPFGFGLSYASFEMSDASVNLVPQKADAKDLDTFAIAHVTVKNTSDSRAGSTVVEVYLHQANAKPIRALSQLVAFQKVKLAPGETKELSIPISRQAFSMFDANLNRVIEASDYEISIGTSASDLPIKSTVTVSKEIRGLNP